MLITLPDKGAVFHGGQSMAAMFMRGRRVWPEWFPYDLFGGGEDGHWSSIQSAMTGLGLSDILGPHPGHWSNTQEAL